MQKHITVSYTHLVFEDGDNKWKSISYYRKGMKIGEIDLKEIPKKLEGKFWGYIEVDEQWEAGLSEIEEDVYKRQLLDWEV